MRDTTGHTAIPASGYSLKNLCEAADVCHCTVTVPSYLGIGLVYIYIYYILFFFLYSKKIYNKVIQYSLNIIIIKIK